MKKLVQRGLLYKDSYEIVEDGILVKRNSIESRHAYKLLFEDMGFHIQQDKKRNELVFILAGLVFMLFQGKIVHGYYREGLTPTEVFYGLRSTWVFCFSSWPSDTLGNETCFFFRVVQNPSYLKIPIVANYRHS